MTEYVRINGTETQAGDEVYLAGAWHKCKSAFVSRGRLVVRWHAGGSVSGPAKNFTVRRAVEGVNA